MLLKDINQEIFKDGKFNKQLKPDHQPHSLNQTEKTWLMTVQQIGSTWITSSSVPGNTCEPCPS